MQSATEFDAGITLTKPTTAISIGSADPIGHKGWAVFDTTKSGAGVVVIRLADGTEKTLASFMLPVPAKDKQNRILVRVSVAVVDTTSVVVKPVEVEGVI